MYINSYELDGLARDRGKTVKRKIRRFAGSFWPLSQMGLIVLLFSSSQGLYVFRPYIILRTQTVWRKPPRKGSPEGDILDGERYCGLKPEISIGHTSQPMQGAGERSIRSVRDYNSPLFFIASIAYAIELLCLPMIFAIFPGD